MAVRPTRRCMADAPSAPTTRYTTDGRGGLGADGGVPMRGKGVPFGVRTKRAGRPRGARNTLPSGTIKGIFNWLAQEEPELSRNAIERGLRAPGAEAPRSSNWPRTTSTASRLSASSCKQTPGYCSWRPGRTWAIRTTTSTRSTSDAPPSPMPRAEPRSLRFGSCKRSARPPHAGDRAREVETVRKATIFASDDEWQRRVRRGLCRAGAARRVRGPVRYWSTPGCK